MPLIRLTIRLMALGLCAAPLCGGAAQGVTPAPQEANAYSFRRGVNISHWLSQNYGSLTYGAPWFTAEDIAWIAAQGFDHIRVPVDYRHWRNEDGSLNEQAIAPFDAACDWAREHGLGVILDMHYLPGTNFTQVDASLYSDPKLIAMAEDFWEKVAARYAQAGPWLRFELLNEPVAERDEQLNRVIRKLLAAVRKTNPERMVYLPSNRWNSFRTVDSLKLPEDPNIALTLHFYEPFPFTHQNASWTALANMPQVDFPGRVPDLSGMLPAEHGWMRHSNAWINAEASIDPAFAGLARWAARHPGLEIHIGEFGAYGKARPEAIRNYVSAVVAAAERHGFAWAIWDYRGGFAVRGSDGEPTAALEGIREATQAVAGQ